MYRRTSRTFLNLEIFKKEEMVKKYIMVQLYSGIIHCMVSISLTKRNKPKTIELTLLMVFFATFCKTPHQAMPTY